MKYLISLLIFFSLKSFAGNQDFGLGVVIGDPTGVALKLKLNPDHAIDGALAWSSLGVHLHGNYLWQNEGYLNLAGQSYDLFYGIGARVISISSGTDKNKTSFGPRAPIGLNYKMKNTRLQFFAELALNLNLTPSSEVDLDGGIGMRFHF